MLSRLKKNLFNFEKNPISLTFFSIFSICILADLLSFLAFINPWLMPFIFTFICLIAIYLSWRHISWGIFLIIAELAFTAQGYLFYLDLGPFKLSLRVALFIIVLGLWLLKKIILLYRARRVSSTSPRSAPESHATLWNLIVKEPLGFFYPYYLLLAIAILWGLIWAFINHNPNLSILGDFNNWLYFLLAPVIFDTLKNISASPITTSNGLAPTSSSTKKIFSIIFATGLALSLHTFIVEYLYSHRFETVMYLLFRWFSDFMIGDITYAGYNFYRVFSESQIYLLVGISALISAWALKQNFFFQTKFRSWLWLTISLTTIIISFSRSFWAGLAGGLIIFSAWLFITHRLNLKKFFHWFFLVASSLVTAVALVSLILNLPPTKNLVNFSDLLSNRLTKNEAASQTRLNQLKPLISVISKHPLIGSGWGTMVTYVNQDPYHFKHDNPQNLYTTYAFEWGYLDFILKFGLFGLFIYGLLLWHTFKFGLRLLRRPPPPTHLTTPNSISPSTILPISNGGASRFASPFTSEQIQIISWLLVLLMIMGVHFFSPYLNHPLGIMILLLTQAWILNFHSAPTPSSSPTPTSIPIPSSDLNSQT